MISADTPSCTGTSRACHVYQTGAHHDGTLEVYLQWRTDDTDLDVEVRCNDQVVYESFRKGGLLEDFHTPIPGGQACEVRVLHSGGPQQYRLYLKFPI